MAYWNRCARSRRAQHSSNARLASRTGPRLANTLNNRTLFATQDPAEPGHRVRLENPAMSVSASYDKAVNPTTVTAYSDTNASFYEEFCNRSFVYGDISAEFLKQISFKKDDGKLLDIGCGTGLVFDVIGEELARNGIECLGIDPAQGMLDVGVKKYESDKSLEFQLGSFEQIPLSDASVDRIVSVLALHWVPAIEPAVREMKRVLKSGGEIDLLMIARDDGYRFKAGVVAAMKKHLSFAQIMRAATLAQRLTAEQLRQAFEQHFDAEISVRNVRTTIHGTFEDHMKWWKARSSAIIAEVEDQEAFFEDLRTELNAMATEQGVPFDLSCLCLSLKG